MKKESRDNKLRRRNLYRSWNLEVGTARFCKNYEVDFSPSNIFDTRLIHVIGRLDLYSRRQADRSRWENSEWVKQKENELGSKIGGHMLESRQWLQLYVSNQIMRKNVRRENRINTIQNRFRRCRLFDDLQTK